VDVLRCVGISLYEFRSAIRIGCRTSVIIADNYCALVAGTVDGHSRMHFHDITARRRHLYAGMEEGRRVIGSRPAAWCCPCAGATECARGRGYMLEGMGLRPVSICRS